MRLRHQFLTLTLVLLVGVVGGSFYWLYTDLRREFEANLKGSLETSVALFRAGESQRYDTLHLLASSLETSPGFRNVLRRTDYLTLEDFIKDLNQAMTVDLVVITDSEGKVKLRTDRTQPGTTLGEHPAVLGALDGFAVRDYWALDAGLFQGVTLPIADSQGYVNGSLTLAYRVDRSFLRTLEDKLGTQLTIKVGGQTLGNERTSNPYGTLSRTVSLGSNSGQAQGSATLETSLQPVHEFVIRSRGRLVALGGVALLAALLVSIPIIGKMTNPVELLAQAQAEMETIFRSNPDGLVALDGRGQITALNPAATLALGAEVEALLGTNISDALPDNTYSQLLGSPAGLVQQADLERQGKIFKLFRTFVRRSDVQDLGSILLLQDASSEREGQVRLETFLQSLEGPLCSTESPFAVRLALQNLLAWSHIRKDALPPGKDRVSVGQLFKHCQALELGGATCPLTVEVESNLDLEGDPNQLQLVLENLLANAFTHGCGPVKLSCRRDGGACEISVAEEGQGIRPDDLVGAGLGLELVRHLVENHGGRLDFQQDDSGHRVSVTLPAFPPESEGA